MANCMIRGLGELLDRSVRIVLHGARITQTS